ncbi:MAG: hydrogenase maturation peptidase HycI [Candidatus Omnitrophota bacterium]|jgi:hydrogenase 3 maturation protease
MPRLKKDLLRRLEGARRVAVVGVGSELRSDDAAGALLAERIKPACRRQKSRGVTLRVFFGFTAPENLTGEIKKFLPSHIIIIDAAELGKRPGSVRLLSEKEIAGVTFSTHRMPLAVLADYLRQSLDCRVIVIGIQPKSVSFGNNLSVPVRKSISALAGLLCETIKNI